MGYEVKYLYYEKGENGYNTEEEKELKAKVGDPFEEVPLEKLAAAIMAQFARRDLMIFNAEVIELSRKPINFRQTDGGIILKNKKYSFDQGAQLHCQDVVETPAPTQLPQTINIAPQRPKAIELVAYDDEQKQQEELQRQQNLKQQQAANKKPVPRLAGMAPIRYEIFDPEPILLQAARERGLQFTQGHRYPIYEERRGDSIAAGLMYVTANDAGIKQIIHSSHFQPELKGLIGDFEPDRAFSGSSSDMISLR